MSELLPPGMLVDAGPAQATSAFQTLVGGNGIDFQGASGPLDFDPATGSVSADIQIWCLPKDPGTQLAGSPVPSGIFYDEKTGMLAGSIGPGCD